MTLNQNGFENSMDVFKSQLQIATSIFYRLPMIDQIHAIQLLKEIVKELQETLSNIQHDINESANDELKNPEQLYDVPELHTSASKTNALLHWKLSYTENNEDVTQLLEDEQCQNCFSISLSQGNCSILTEGGDDQASSTLKETTIPMKTNPDTVSNLECTTEEASNLISSEKFNLVQDNTSLSSTIPLKSTCQNDLLQVIDGNSSANDSCQKVADNKLLISDKSTNDEHEATVQDKSEIPISYDPLSSNILGKDIIEPDDEVKRTENSESQQSEFSNYTIVNHFTDTMDFDKCNNEMFKKTSEAKNDSVRLKKRKKYEQLIGTRSSQRLATKRQKLKHSLNKQSQKHFEELSLIGDNTYKSQSIENTVHQSAGILMSDTSSKEKTKSKQKSVEQATDVDKSKLEELHELRTNLHLTKSNGTSSETLPVSCRQCRTEFSDLGHFSQHTCKEVAEFYCDKCNVKFSHPQHFHKHMNGHNRNNCKICNAQFAKRKALCKHLKYAHKIFEAEKLYECTFCDRKFIKRPSLYVHLKEHAGEKMVCLKCGLMCDTKEQYDKHMLKHSEEAKFHCLKCNECFSRRQQFEQHMLGHDKYDCNVCNLSFSTKKHLVKHQRVVHCIYSHEDKKHECTICKKKFQRPMLLEIHMRLHTGERPIQCVHCEKNFRTPKALAKHLKTTAHLKASGQSGEQSNDLEKSFLCAECGAKFYRKQGLLRHMQQLHSDERPFVCPYCEYSCKCKTNLKRHIELHTNEKKFICELCGASFHARATLKEHHAYVHSDVRSFVCSDCGKGFKGRSGLRRHVRIHSDARPYVCYCGQSYKRMSHLKRHMISIHGSTFKSKRVTRLTDENSQPTNNDVFADKQDLSSSLDDAKTVVLESDVNKLKLLEQDKVVTTENGNLTFKVQNAVIEMLQNISIEQLDSSSDSNNILPENSSLQHLLSLTSNQETSVSNTLHIIQSSSLECTSDLQFSFSSSSNSSEEHHSSHCVLNNQISLQSNTSPSNEKYLLSSNAADSLISTDPSPSLLATNGAGQSTLGSTHLFSSLNCDNCSLPVNPQNENEISLKYNNEIFLKNSNNKFSTSNDNEESKLDSIESSATISTSSTMPVLKSSEEITSMLTLPTSETNTLSVSDTNNILVQSANTLHFNHTKY